MPIGRSKIKIDTQKSFNDMDSSLKELKKMIESSKAELVFINSMGEAFVNDKLKDIINLIKNKGVAVRLLSNFNLFYLIFFNHSIFNVYYSITLRCDSWIMCYNNYSFSFLI